MSEKNLVIQHNKIIEARYKLTVEEQRLIKTLVSQIQPGDEDFKVYEIRVADLAKLIGITDDYYYNRIKKLTKKLRDNSLTFTNENGDEVQTGWLSSAVYRKGMGSVELRFDPVLKPYLLQLKQLFTSYELGNILRLKGTHSIRMYELLKQYQNVGVRDFELLHLKQILQIESEYSEYRDFKRYVLMPSGKEISENTDIRCSFSEKKQGRRVVGLKFYIEANNSKKANHIKKDAGQINLEIKPINALINKLVNFGVKRRTADKIVRDYSEERIKVAITYMQSLQKQGKVSNPPGFIIEAIKNEYRDIQTESIELKKREEKANADKEKAEKALKEKNSEIRKQAVDSFISALTENQLAELQSEFIDSVKDNAPVMKSFSKNGMKSKMVEAHYRDFIFKKI